MEEGRERAKNRPIELDWDKLLPSGADGDDRPATIVIVKTKTLGSATKNSPEMAANEASVEQLTDHELFERIGSTKKTISMISHTMPDKGEKLLNSLRRLEDESERRKRRRPETIQLEESDGFEKPAPPINSSSTGGSKHFRGDNTTSQDPIDSSFATNFFKRMDENTKGRKSNAFDREVSLLGPCNQQKMRNDRDFSKKRRRDDRSSPRRSSSKYPDNLAREGGKRVISNSNEKGRASSILSQDIRENFANFPEKKKDPLPFSNSHETRHRKELTIVLEDEEEPQLIEILQLVEKPDESMQDVKIYYPSRHDPEAVEISYSDFDCLAPQAYLRSNIMNFYIRYLQQHVSPTNRVMRNCHFFNTYFYNKLKEVLSNKGNSRDEFFVKFRRWWKGLNSIFQKEYILIPINEDVHWSLVIICIPDKEEQSGPIILHLDSLGLHSSRSVFQNIKSFLIEEWNHLRRDVSCSGLPFADIIWENLPRRIMENTIAVPQQKNDYDCGLFVLYFMQRFVEDAPGRLKKKDLAMFGKQWFKPEEASGLRVKINKLLLEEFKNARKSDNALEPSPSSPSSPPSLYDVVEV